MSINLMPIEHIDDWEKRIERNDAFWYGEIIDRPVCGIMLPKEKPEHPWPTPKSWPSLRDRWFDAEYVAECALSWTMNTDFLGDALPYHWPNLGPEVFSACFGCELEYSETTSWAIPNIHDWSDASKVRFSEDSPYWKKIIELMDACMHYGKGKFYTNFTDLHAGGDAVAALRDPQQLCIDLVESPDEVKKLLAYVTDVYLDVLDFFHDRILSAGHPIGAGGNSIQSTKRWHYAANDFSYMISKEMFDDIFLPEIVREVQHLEACYYHLDGEGALRHLDSLLEVPEINVIQWVYSGYNGPASNWMETYRKIQAAGKGIDIGLHVDELDYFMENLKPNGLWIHLGGVQDHEHAAAMLKKLSTWGAK